MCYYEPNLRYFCKDSAVIAILPSKETVEDGGIRIIVSIHNDVIRLIIVQ